MTATTSTIAISSVMTTSLIDSLTNVVDVEGDLVVHAGRELFREPVHRRPHFARDVERVRGGQRETPSRPTSGR
jgi:hypothetical protein